MTRLRPFDQAQGYGGQARLVLAGGRIIDPASPAGQAGRDEVGDLIIEGGRIARFGPAGSLKGAERVLDCRGKIVSPGFIDLHVHLREPPVARAASRVGGADLAALPETIATGAAAAAAGGFTTVCAMPNTDPPMDSAEAVAYYLARGREANLARVLPIGAMTRGRAGREPADLAAMKAAGAVAFSDDGSDVADAKIFEAVLRRAASIGAATICHCEDARLAAGGIVNDGPMTLALGLPGIPAEAEIEAVERACRLASETGCRVHIAHVSTAGAVATVRLAKAGGLPVTAEATPHHLALTHEALRGRESVFKVSPPLRSASDVAAVIEGVRDGTIDCLATDHAPHTAAAKAKGLVAAPPGMIGLESALPVYVRALIEPGILDWPELIARLTVNPARVLGLPYGTLAVGAEADVTVMDPDAEWVIDPARFASRARNCPFAGWKVKGRVKQTLVGGRIAYEDRC
ncbi:MAG TPA: dihydroorotase [Phycisphaerae bacterium]|nr:dihydroorotase [Phycisphaerae bacterium]